MKTKFLHSRVSLLLFVLPVMLFSCSKEAAVVSVNGDLSAQSKISAGSALTDASAAYKTYIIEQGNHYANGKHFPAYSGKVLSFSAIFDSSAIYNFTNPNTASDQNTLYGFADNGKRHEFFSARFGWRWYNNQLQIAAYTENNNVPTILQIGSVPLGVASTYSIAVMGDHYDFTLNGVTTSLPRASKTASAGNYKLLPYFGGNAVAPQQIAIKIQDN